MSMNTDFIKGGDLEWAAVQIDVRLPSHSPYANGWALYATWDNADKLCHEMSAALPDAEISIRQASRIRAVYKGGVRTVTRSMESFYDMSVEEYDSYKILNHLYGSKNPKEPHYF